jgi:protein phosphatase
MAIPASPSLLPLAYSQIVSAFFLQVACLAVRTTSNNVTQKRSLPAYWIGCWIGFATCGREAYLSEISMDMPTRRRSCCPHCISVCLVDEEHLGQVVVCSRCRKPFTAASAVGSDGTGTEPLPAAAGALRFEVAGVTSTGHKRSRNEDGFLIQHLTWFERQNYQLSLVIVADGVGGHAAGELAAAVVIRSIGSALAPLLCGALSGAFKNASRKKLANAVEAALQDANNAVRQQAAVHPDFKGMAATAAVVLIWNGRVVIGHVGDCRVYHFHQGVLKQVTKDQTVVARMVELGQLTPEEALRNPARNQISQAIGSRAVLESAFHDRPPEKKSWDSDCVSSPATGTLYWSKKLTLRIVIAICGAQPARVTRFLFELDRNRDVRRVVMENACGVARSLFREEERSNGQESALQACIGTAGGPTCTGYFQLGWRRRS